MPTIVAENRDVVGEAYNLNPSQYEGINYDLIVPEGVTVRSQTSNAIDSYEPEGAHTITVHGTVIADDDGVKLLGVQGTSHVIISETGVRYTSFAYDAKDRVISSTVHGSPADTTMLNYDGANHVTVTTAHEGTRAYTFQAGMYRRPLSTIDSAGNSRKSYDL